MSPARSRWIASLVLLASTCTRESSTTPTTSGSAPVIVEAEPSDQPPPAEGPPRYPNELSGYALHSSGAWRELVPLESTLADVRRVLGEPSDAHDIANYVAPYPGDAAAVQPVLSYDISKEWDLLVYLVRSDLSVSGDFPAGVQDKLLSLDFVPDHDLPFPAEFSPVWRSKKVMAADAGWTTWADGSGLEYQIYGDGRLNRISYGPSDAQLTTLGMTPGSGK